MMNEERIERLAIKLDAVSYIIVSSFSESPYISTHKVRRRVGI